MTPRLLVPFLVAALGGCDMPVGGDRTGGGCPAGEVCAPDTPLGLYFTGAPFASTLFENDLAPKPTAVGGTQRITAYADADGEVPFAAPFQAAGTGPLTPSAVAPPSVVIGGDQAGTGYLRILDEQDQLYDRIALELAEVEQVEAGPMLDWWFADYDMDRFALWVGGAADLEVRLRGLTRVGLERLVDESMVVELPAGSGSDPRWDVVRVRPQVAGRFDMRVILGSGAEHGIALAAVDQVDDIVPVDSAYSPAEAVLEEVPDSARPVFCFRAVHESGSGPLAILGVPEQYSAGGVLTVDEVVEGGGYCVRLQPTGAGVGQLTVTLGDLTRTWEITVVEGPPPQGARLRPEALGWKGTDLAVGERAAQFPVQ